jgi:UPF0755 protein
MENQMENYKFKKIIKIPQNTILLISLLGIFVCVLMSGGILYLHYKINMPIGGKYQEKIFTVSSGKTAKDIAKELENSGLITNKLFFMIYFKNISKKLNEPPTIKAGQYLISTKLNIPKITQLLIDGEINANQASITIPEGYNVLQIAQLLEKKEIIKKDDFLSFASNYYPATIKEKEQSLIKFMNCDSGEALCELNFPAEGYLFPDTYYLKKGEDAVNVANKFVDNFNKKLLLLDYEEKGVMKENIILASILEREVKEYSDKQIVAGILLKRLDANMPLQVDSTILYAKTLEDNLVETNYEHNPVSIEDTEIESAYNTYQKLGFPSGPICNPGIESIKASINSIKTDYWYYLSTKEGKTIFSKTYDEHLENKEKYLE